MPFAPSRRSLTAVALVALALGAAGCGNGDVAQPDSADASCRAQWKDLADSIATRTPDTDEPAQPSALADRWNTVAAGVQYYVTSATVKDCGDTLSNQRLSIDALIDFETGLQAFDMEYQRDQLTGPAQAYLDGALPEPKKGKAVPKAKVTEALDVLSAQATTASTDLQPGWQEANEVDLADRDAVQQAISDLTLLGKHSTAYQECQIAVDTIRKAISQLID